MGLASAARRALRHLGVDVVRYRPDRGSSGLPPDVSDADREVIDHIRRYTMTSEERQIALIHAARHVARRIEGDFVECGVWRGGSAMAMALVLLQEGERERQLYLFDTFEGMTHPSDVDRTGDGTPAQALLDRDARRTGSVWAVAGIEDVRENMRSTGYPLEHVHLVKGPVESTIPGRAPAGPIALLRLDTDWYESTRHELEHLFPRVCEGGIVIIDDYGHWAGARKAVDEYLAGRGETYFLHRIDYTGRLLVKR